jgi:hypothetical protein
MHDIPRPTTRTVKIRANIMRKAVLRVNVAHSRTRAASAAAAVAGVTTSGFV